MMCAFAWRPFLEEHEHVPFAVTREVTEIGDFSFGSANSSRRDICRTPDRGDPSKQRLFCNPNRRGVQFIARVADARDESQEPTWAIVRLLLPDDAVADAASIALLVRN